MAQRMVDQQPSTSRASHPSYVNMVKEAITFLHEKNGSSRQKITKYIITSHFVTPDLVRVNYHVSAALKKCVADGTLIQTKGTGAIGSFKLGEVNAKKKAEKAGKQSKELASKVKKNAEKTVKQSEELSHMDKLGKAVTKRKRQLAPVAARILDSTFSVSGDSSQEDIPELSFDETRKKVRSEVTPKQKRPLKEIKPANKIDETRTRPRAKITPKKKVVSKKKAPLKEKMVQAKKVQK